MNRKRALLASLLLLLLLSIGYSIYDSPRQKRVSAPQTLPATSRNATAVQKAQPADGDERLRIDLLKPAPRRYSGVNRDLFYGEVPKVVKPLPSTPLPPPVVALPPVVIPQPPIISVETRMELGRYVFLGYLEKAGVKTIFLGSSGEVFVVKKGQRFGKKGEFLIVELTPTLMTVQGRDNPQPITLPLVEKESLTPPTEEVLRTGRAVTPSRVLPSTEPFIDEQAAEAPVPAPLEEPSLEEGAPLKTEGQPDGSDEE